MSGSPRPRWPIARFAASPSYPADWPGSRTTIKFYRRTDLSLDFYRAVKDDQRRYLASRTYARAVTAFGLGLVPVTGSRKARRQSDLSADRDMNLRQIRAIPHNAVLQQLGYPVNVIAGIGSAADGRFEEMAALLAESARGAPDRAAGARGQCARQHQDRRRVRRDVQRRVLG